MNIRRWPITLIVLASSIHCVGDFSRTGATRAAARITAGPMVQSIAEDSFYLVWRTGDGSSAKARVSAGADGAWLEGTVVEEKSGRFAARFGGLEPSTTYRYQIVADEEVLAEASTRTAPKPGEPFRFIAFGDSGTGSKEQFRLAERMTPWEPRLILHTGDLIYPFGARRDYGKKFYLPYAPLLSAAPIYACIGNHDVFTDRGMPLIEEFVLPQNAPPGETPERHFWFDFGDVRFAGLDSNLPREELRDRAAPWLDRLLADAGDRWKVVFFHHPVYTNAKHDPTDRIRETLVPVLDARRVELVLVGHNHLYERSHPIRGGAVVEAGGGTVYITTGAGGAGLYSRRAKPSPELAVQFDARHSFTVIDVSAETLSLRQIDIEGEVVDEAVIRRMNP
jgi:predicted phosphodiesterase